MIASERRRVCRGNVILVRVIWMDMKYIYKVLFFVIIIIDHYYL